MATSRPLRHPARCLLLGAVLASAAVVPMAPVPAAAQESILASLDPKAATLGLPDGPEIVQSSQGTTMSPGLDALP